MQGRLLSLRVRVFESFFSALTFGANINGLPSYWVHGSLVVMLSLYGVTIRQGQYFIRTGFWADVNRWIKPGH